MDQYTDVDEVIDVALESGETQLRRIESLRDIRKWEEGQMPLNLKALALKAVARKSIASLLSIANEAEIRILDRIPDDLPAVYIDEDHLNRVLCNLLDNALRHAPGGGEVRLEAVALASNAAGKSMVKISVIDTGKGIPPEFRKRIFDKFVQVPNSAVRGRRGSGLGLTFCRLMIEAHGGQIWVENGPEGGAAFSFTLPTAHENQDKDVSS
jgi:signal transduction histidine kinase